jgi:3-oxoacyl-[acyl-carrier-protein] synthase-3
MSKGKMDDHLFNSGDLAVMASVGAGMNINAVVYKQPSPGNYGC